MMTSVILFVCFSALALAADEPLPSYHPPPQTYPLPQSGYAPQQGSYPPQHGSYQPHNGPNAIIYDIKNLLQNVTYLNGADEAIDSRIEALLADNRLNSMVRETFLNQHYPEIQKEQQQQDALLTDLEKKAKSLLQLTDDVAQIASTIDELNAQLAEIDEKRQGYLAQIAALQNTDATQDTRLEKINEALAEAEAQLDALEEKSHYIANRIHKLEKTLHQVFDALGSEGAWTREFTMTPHNDVQKAYLPIDFGGRMPQVQYGITSLYVSDHENSYDVKSSGYGSQGGYGDQSYSIDNISFDIDVQYDVDSHQVTVRAFDFSKGGWFVNKIGVQVTIFRIDDRIIDTYQD